jgi:hypothetical protein
LLEFLLLLYSALFHYVPESRRFDINGDNKMSDNKVECRYLNRDEDHPSFIFLVSHNENPYEKYAGVCTASGTFTRSIQCLKVTEEDISNYCGKESKYRKCNTYIRKTYGSLLK